MINHHTIARDGQVYFPPLKRAVLDDEGTLRLVWWKGNEEMNHERVKVNEAGLDTKQILTCDEFISGDDVFFVASGITDGTLMSGVRYLGDRAQTESMVLRCKTKTRRVVITEHLIE